MDEIAAAWAPVPQLSLLARRLPEPSCSSKTGSDNVPESENGGAARDGPSARMISLFDVEPSMMRPAMRTLWSVPTCPRVEILDKRLDKESNSYTSTNPMPVELL